MVIVIGLGFTGTRLARRLLVRAEDTASIVRRPDRFPDLARAGLRLFEWTEAMATPSLLPEGALVAWLTPPLPEPENARLRECIRRAMPRRIIYLSSTGVYGAQENVDEESRAFPSDERGRRRLEEEQWISGGDWSSLILRAAAIYGPGRGVHAALREGRIPRGADSGIVSRVHVDDLAALVDAGLFSEAGGAWPVADEEPSTTAEIIRWCLDSGELQITEGAGTEGVGVPVKGRRVHGGKIREILEVPLKYRSWRTGVPASLREEAVI